MGGAVWLLLLLATLAMVFLYIFHGGSRDGITSTRIIGNGGFGVEITTVGQHLANLKKICGRRTADCINRKIEAYLTLENNKYSDHAVRVSIEGYTVGYLPSASAVELRHALTGAGLGKSTVLECAAHIRGTWDKECREQSNYGVWLDLPVADAL